MYACKCEFNVRNKNICTDIFYLAFSLSRNKPFIEVYLIYSSRTYSKLEMNL